jgi:hypothetical protein
MKSTDMYKPSGDLQGDTSAMPDRGTSTGMVDNTDLGGMSLDPSATNSKGGIGGSTKSDDEMRDMPDAATGKV